MIGISRLSFESDLVFLGTTETLADIGLRLTPYCFLGIEPNQLVFLLTVRGALDFDRLCIHGYGGTHLNVKSRPIIDNIKVAIQSTCHSGSDPEVRVEIIKAAESQRLRYPLKWEHVDLRISKTSCLANQNTDS